MFPKSFSEMTLQFIPSDEEAILEYSACVAFNLTCTRACVCLRACKTQHQADNTELGHAYSV